MNNSPGIGKALGIPETIDVTSSHEIVPVPAEPANVPQNVNTDYEFARSSLYTVIENGQDALQELMQVAVTSQHPRSYEVLATLMRTLVDANKDLLTLSKTKVDIETAARPEGGDKKDSGTVNNNLFVGTSSELLQLLKNQKQS